MAELNQALECANKIIQEKNEIFAAEVEEQMSLIDELKNIIEVKSDEMKKAKVEWELEK